MADTKVSLKLLIDTGSQKVLFAEAGKDFVDFLFNLLALPVGTVIRLLTKDDMAGSLGNLYVSIENLSETYMQPNQSKDSVLKPKSPALTQIPLLLTNDAQAPTSSNNFYSGGYSTGSYGSKANHNHTSYPGQASGAKPSSSDEGGFVKGMVTYMVMDDLVVKPMSTISSITLLNKFNVKELGALEEKVVDLTRAESLKLLKASLQSKAVLTSVFLGNTGA